MGIQTVSQALSNENGGFSPFGFKNRIINGAMVIDQRNAGASVTPANGDYTLDRWICFQTTASKYSVQQQTSVVPTGFTYAAKITSLSSYSVLSSDYYTFQQKIEGYNIADLGWGTANAKTITISFWVYSSLTGTFGGSFFNPSGTRSYPFTYTISAANTWEQKSVTIAGDTSGTWPTVNDTGIILAFTLGVGSTGAGPAGAWASAFYTGPTGATSIVGSSGATWYVTGVQLEKAPQATAFDYRPYGTEEALCQRYFYSYGGTTGYERMAVGVCSSTVSASVITFLPVSMRSAPSLSYSAVGHFGVYDGGNVTAVTALAIDQPTEKVVTVTATVASGLTQYRPAQLLGNNNTAARLKFSAEM